jgi:hypothetical protein
VTISDKELVDALEKEAAYRRESGANPAKRDTDFIAAAEAAIAELKAHPGSKQGREIARNLAGKIESKPFKGRRLD